MKRIGILTFHYADNYGAVLQAYALQKTLNTFEGYEAEIINYVPVGYKLKPHEKGKNALIRFWERRRKIEKFLREQCKITTVMLSSVQGNAYDYYCVGSDQVWNTQLPENVEYEYFLPHLTDEAVRFSYAASVGIEMSKVQEEVFYKYIPKFSYISLREKEYIDSFASFTDTKCHHVLDPTMLLEKEDYEQLIDRKKEEDLPYKKPYVLFFWYHIEDDLFRCVEFVNALARKYGLEVVHSVADAPPYMFCENGGYMMYSGIEEFLSLVKHADFVVTNSYHGSIFAMQFERPFYMFISTNRRSRLDNLVEMFGIEDRVVKGYMSPAQMNMDIDFDKIKKIMREKKKTSMQYISEAIAD